MTSIRFQQRFHSFNEALKPGHTEEIFRKTGFFKSHDINRV